ncbi:MAG: adenylate/guanylate cyclase domain-containing protein, partial [Deltaproteobacteria bacterium]
MTDVEGSTRLWRESTEAAAVMRRHGELIGAAVARHGGVQPLEQGEGDSTVAAFVRASDAVAAALDAQRALSTEPWPDGARVLVRMAIHTGEASLRTAGAYGGSAIIRCARLRALAHGGQVVVSTATKEVAAGALPPGVMIAEVGSVRLDGFDNRERVHQLCHPDLPAGIRTLRRPSSTGIGSWPTALVGRVSEREEVAALLAQNRLVTIAGAGGAGKTRLAYAVGEDIAADYPDGVAWVDLARLSDGVQVPSAVAAACGLREVPGAATMDLLTRALAETRTLIVLDNCEHLLDACAQATDALLRAAPHIRVLATAREPLGVAGEVTWRIPPLALPPEGERDLERVGAFDAVRLFVARARAAAPTFRLAADNATTVARICRRLDGLPLALELAAARVRALSVDRLADALDDRFRLLTGGARTAVARQRTLLASIEWSHDLLDESERVSFRRLGVFAAPFDLDAAEAIAAGDDLDPRDVRDVLARLVDKTGSSRSSVPATRASLPRCVRDISPGFGAVPRRGGSTASWRRLPCSRRSTPTRRTSRRRSNGRSKPSAHRRSNCCTRWSSTGEAGGRTT